MPPQALAAVAAMLAFSTHGNLVEFKLDHGSAALEWNSEKSFRFRRTLEGPLPTVDPVPGAAKAVTFKIEDSQSVVHIRTAVLDVAIQKHGLLVSVQNAQHQMLLKDLAEPRVSAGGVAWECESRLGERFYGLGPRPDAQLDLSGRAVTATVPLLLSSSSYGEFQAGGGPWRFDFTNAGRYRIEAPRMDYFFYWGATPKDIFHEHHNVFDSQTQGQAPWQYEAPSVTWDGLRQAVLTMVGGAMSAVVYPSFNLAKFEGADPVLQRRARQVGSLVPRVAPGKVGLSDFRGQLKSFFTVYGPEQDYYGYPTWHALPFQFPFDPECALHADEFMLGDEMLIAPIMDASGARQVYLPQGIWTNLETNQVQNGRTTIAVKTESLPVFARNGTIVPLDDPNGMALHYFPELGAEFFLLEQDTGEYSQIHAAPADDIMRLEIESKRDRPYLWVVHHIDRPASVGFEQRMYRPAASLDALANGSWYYDAGQRNLYIRVDVKAGEDNIINLGF